MQKLTLSVAIGNYDRVRPLADGDVLIDGVGPVFQFLEPEEIFFRAFRHVEFDICELSLSSFCIKTAAGACPYVAVPVFPSRAFRHTAITVRTDRIREPKDLIGRRIGVPEYQLTANVWARALLADQYGVKPADIRWVQAGLEEPGRIEKIAFSLPSGVRIEADPNHSLSELLLKGDIDGVIAPRVPSCFGEENNVGWLFRDPVAAAKSYYAATGIFPIMHVLGVKRPLLEAHPWLAMALTKAFTRSKDLAIKRLMDPSASKVTLPFSEERVYEARQLMSDDFWPYGLERNRATLENFLGHHHSQGLSARLLAPEDLFAPSSLEAFKI